MVTVPKLVDCVTKTHTQQKYNTESGKNSKLVHSYTKYNTQYIQPPQN